MTLLLQANGISYAHGGHQIFENVSFEIKSGDRFALLGPNGAGKSTLFRLLAGELQPQSGAVTQRRGIHIGYLHQETAIDPEMTVLETVALAAGDPEALDLHLTRLELRMAEPLDDDQLTAVMDEYAETLARIEEVRDDRVPLPGAEILSGLRVPEADWAKPVGQLSGGEKKIVALAGLLASQPDVLLLDEPDNHLDLEAKAWLERLLAKSDGAVATITHDRYFVDRVSNRIFELAHGKITVYHGNYSYYRTERQARHERASELRELQEREFKKLKASAEQLTQWARQNPKFAPRAENMRRKLEEERLKLEETRIPALERRPADFSFSTERGATVILDATAASFSYPHREIAKPFDLEIRSGERIGLVGPNGSGKTSLLRVLAGQVPPTDGTVRLGPAVVLGYYAQEQENLPTKQTAIEYIRRLQPYTEQQAISFLGTLQLDREAGLTQIGRLSGGEKARLQIAGLILGGANFLVLDEPTNNLDLQAIEALESALEDFPGTILAVSHDRYFLERICSRTLEIRSGTVRDFPGNFAWYDDHPESGVILSSKISLRR
jgi:ATP-binding cassette subfamily F protein 3